MLRKLGIILISLITLSTFTGGCGTKIDKTPINAPKETVPLQPNTPNYQPTSSTAPEPPPENVDTQKIDVNTAQGQAAIDGSMEQQMKYLDETLDNLDKSIEGIGSI